MPTTINVAAGDATNCETPALVVNLFQGVTQPGGGTGAVDRALGGAISQLIADGEIKGKLGELTLIHTMERIPARRVVVAGLGKSTDFDTGAVRRVSGDVARFLRRKGISEYATIAHGAGIGGLNAVESAQAIAEGTLLGLYKFDNYRSNGNGAGGDTDSDGSPNGGVKCVTIVERDAGAVGRSGSRRVRGYGAGGVDDAGAGPGEPSGQRDDTDEDGGGGPRGGRIRRPRTGRDGPGPDA